MLLDWLHFGVFYRRGLAVGMSSNGAASFSAAAAGIFASDGRRRTFNRSGGPWRSYHSAIRWDVPHRPDHPLHSSQLPIPETVAFLLELYWSRGLNIFSATAALC